MEVHQFRWQEYEIAITLPARKGQLTANYRSTGYILLFVRFGLSPDLLDLMQNGQKYLSGLTSDTQDVNLLIPILTGKSAPISF